MWWDSKIIQFLFHTIFLFLFVWFPEVTKQNECRTWSVGLEFLTDNLSLGIDMAFPIHCSWIFFASVWLSPDGLINRPDRWRNSFLGFFVVFVRSRDHFSIPRFISFLFIIWGFPGKSYLPMEKRLDLTNRQVNRKTLFSLTGISSQAFLSSLTTWICLLLLPFLSQSLKTNSIFCDL